MNISEANAVNVVARALDEKTPAVVRPSVEQLQSALDLLLDGAYRKLSAGLRPGEARVLPSLGGDS